MSKCIHCGKPVMLASTCVKCRILWRNRTPSKESLSVFERVYRLVCLVDHDPNVHSPGLLVQHWHHAADLVTIQLHRMGIRQATREGPSRGR